MKTSDNLQEHIKNLKLPKPTAPGGLFFNKYS